MDRIRLLTLLNFLLYYAHANKEEFHEELLIKPLPTGHISSKFSFSVFWEKHFIRNYIDQTYSEPQLKNFDEVVHYGLFPKALGEVLQHFSVQELHLSLTQGQWRQVQWGQTDNSAAPGAELLVWFQQHTQQVEEKWRGLTSTLSGMFCTSLNFMSGKNTVIPRLTFKPRGLSPTNHSAVRYSQLTEEVTCTENLTPWKKLLPCGTKVGLSSLLQSLKLVDSSYFSLQVHFSHNCLEESCVSRGVELKLLLDHVIDARVTHKNKPDWSFQSVFGGMLKQPCPVSSTSHVLLDTRHLPPDWRVELEPNRTLGSVHVYDLRQRSATLRLGGAHVTSHASLTSLAPVLLHRYVTGAEESPGVRAVINSNSESRLRALYSEALPWFLRMRLSSLELRVNGRLTKPKTLRYVPARDRLSPHHLELEFYLPPAANASIRYSFTKALLKWTEYPPDANHGFPLPTAVLEARPVGDVICPRHSRTLLDTVLRPCEVIRVHSESLSVTLPTPDFSMPYNVICLVCTVLAIAFGSLHNLTTRRFVIASDADLKPNLLTRIVRSIKSRFSRSSTSQTSHKSPTISPTSPDDGEWSAAGGSEMDDETAEEMRSRLEESMDVD